MPFPALFRRSLRLLRRQPLYAAAVTATLALAVAAAIASLAVIKRAFFDPLPYPDAGRLVSVLTVIEGETWAVAAPVYEDLRASGAPLDAYAPIDPEGVTHSDGQSSEQIGGAYVTPAYFSVLGAAPAFGRAWSEDERHVAIVSWRFWQTRLSGAPDAVGRSIVIDGVPRVLVGVLPENFIGPYFATTAVWMPLDVAPLMAGSGRARRTLSVVARLSPGATVEQLNARLEVFSTDLQQRHPQIHGRQSWIAKPLRDELAGTAGPVLMATGAATALLILIVVANVAGLSAARAVGMRQQHAVQLALGATGFRLFAESLVDSIVLAIAGSAAGIWLGDLAVGIVRAYQSQFLPRLAPVAVDWTTAALGCAVALVASVMAALAPLGARRAQISLEVLRASRGAADGGATRVRSLLVVAQVAFALVLLVAAGLIVRTMHHLSTTSLGFDPDGLTAFSVSMPGEKYRTAASQLQYEDQMLERLRQIPGVQSASASVGFPVVGNTRASLSIFGRSDESGRGEITYMSLSPGFLASTRMRLLAGRDLLPSDDGKAPPVVLINETMARQYWPAGDAIGARTRIGPGTTGPWITVVGIVADVSQHGPTQPIIATAFGSTRQYSWPRRHFSVRSASSSAVLAPELRAIVRAVDPDVPMGPIQTVADMVDAQTGRHRLVMISLGFFGVAATVLCAFGLYAVVALSSQLRRRDYAIRLALGAAVGDLRWMVVRQSLALGGAGAVAGLVLAGIATQTLRGLLHGVSPVDAPTFAAAAACVIGLAVVSAWLPARAAGRVDPVEALKGE